jgi:gliding motility-associated-like protein
MKTLIFLKVVLSGLFLSIVMNMIAQNYSSSVSTYRVTAYQKGNDQITSMSNEAAIIPAAVLYVPNAFTPNGDGLNDTFACVGEGITEFDLQIFNRWGELIFESNDMKVQWDGSYKNEVAPIGVYVYKIIAKGPGINGKSKKQIYENGSVTLVI